MIKKIKSVNAWDMQSVIVSFSRHLLYNKLEFGFSPLIKLYIRYST